VDQEKHTPQLPRTPKRRLKTPGQAKRGQRRQKTEVLHRNNQSWKPREKERKNEIN